MRLLAAHGLRPDTELGQHFLLDENLVDLAVREAGVGPGDTVLEVGAGLGVLTAALARAAGTVHAVEIDRRLEPALHEAVAGARNVRLHWGDALRMPLEELDPAPTATTRGWAASRRSHTRSSGVNPSASCGCTPTAAYTSGWASARATAHSLDSRPTPMVTIRSTPAATASATTAAGSSSQESRCAWVSTTPPSPPRAGRAGPWGPPWRPASPRPSRRARGPWRGSTGPAAPRGG